LTVLDPATRTVLSSLAAGLTPDAKQLFLTSPLAGSIAVIDRASRAIVRTITGAGRPRNVAFQPGACTAIVSDELGRVLFIR
jgi:DNA-binding beta-propeller fold protein YncE